MATAEEMQAAFNRAMHETKARHIADYQQLEQQFGVEITESYVTGKGMTLTAKEAPRPKLQAYSVKASVTVPLSARQPAKS